jgi:HlyD family secretion protein
MVKFTVEAFPEQSFDGVVKQVRYAPENVSNVVTYTTVVDVENPGKKLMPGMTATVSIIVGEAKDVLRVPNSALRFTPGLSPEEMQKLMAEMMAEMRAQREQQGEQTGQQGQRPDDSQRGRGDGNRMMGGQSGSSRRQQAPRIWTLDENGKLRMAFIRIGVAGDNYVELLRSDLKEGDLVIIGTESPQSGSSSQGFGGRSMRMFMGR